MRRLTGTLLGWVLTLGMVPLGTSWAVTPDDAQVYYEIGGGEPLRGPSTFNTTATIDASQSLGVRYDCGSFDMGAGLLTSYEEIVDLISNFDEVLAASLGVLPLYFIQRLNPGFYDLLMNGINEGQELLRVSTKNCREMQRELGRGKNPYEEWVVASAGESWRTTIGAGGVDARTAEKTIDENIGLNGMHWVCGERAGGDGDEPIKLVSDLTRAGWGMLVHQSPCATGGAGADEGRIGTIWPSGDEAAEWVAGVVGDREIYTNGTAPKTRAGAGLSREVAVLSEERLVTLVDLVDRGSLPSVEELREVSGEQVVINVSTIEALQQMPAGQRGVFVRRLAGDVSAETVIEKALHARDLLDAGRAEANVAGTPAAAGAQRYIDELQEQIESVLFDRQVRSQFTANTALSIERLENRKRGEWVPSTLPKSRAPLGDGAVRPAEQ